MTNNNLLKQFSIMKKIPLLFFLMIFIQTTVQTQAQNNLIASYPLNNSASDVTGRNGEMYLLNIVYQNEGIYCNGVYHYGGDGSDLPCAAKTTGLTDFNFYGFTIDVDFMVTEYRFQPVIVGGDGCRWVGFYLNNNGKIQLMYNNNTFELSDLGYDLNIWHNAKISYNGTTLVMYMDNTIACSINVDLNFNICFTPDTQIGINNYSSGEAFKGYIKNLKIYSDPMVFGLIANYDLTSSSVDFTGNNYNMILYNAPFGNGGVYCSGKYIGSGALNPCIVETPEIRNFNFNSFTISADFMVSSYKNQPVFVGGTGCRWLGYYLQPDGKLSLLYNNQFFMSTGVDYSLNEWHNAKIAYADSVAYLYYDNELVNSQKIKLNYSECIANDTRITVTNYSNGDVLEGYIKNIKIYNNPIKELSVSTNSVIINNNSFNTASFNIYSNTNWSVLRDANWLTIENSRGTMNSLVNVVAENPISTPRTAYVYVVGKDCSSQRIAVSQMAATTTNNSTVDKDKFEIYPNPVEGILYFNYTADEVQIYDLLGSLIVNIQTPIQSLDLNFLKDGLYVICINNTVIKKIVKR